MYILPIVRDFDSILTDGVNRQKAVWYTAFRKILPVEFSAFRFAIQICILMRGFIVDNVVACRSQWPRGRSLSGIVGANPAGALMSVSCECCVLSGRGLCDELITSPEESYWLWCVRVWWWSLDIEVALVHCGLLGYGHWLSFDVTSCVKGPRLWMWWVADRKCLPPWGSVLSLFLPIRFTDWGVFWFTGLRGGRGGTAFH